MKTSFYFSKSRSGSSFSSFSKDLSREYDDSTLNFRQKYLRLFLLASWVFNFLTWHLNPYDLDNYQGFYLTFQLLYNLTFIVLFFLSYKFPSFSTFILVFIVLLNSALLIEFFKLKETEIKTFNFFLCGQMVSGNIFVLIVGKGGWRLSTITALIITIHFFLRISSDWEQRFALRLNQILTCFLCLIFAVFCSYYSELEAKGNFNQIKTIERHYAQFKNLIMQVFPSSIIICQRSGVVFVNEKVIGDFETKENSFTYEDLGLIILEERNNKMNSDILARSLEERGRKMFFQRPKTLNVKAVLDSLLLDKLDLFGPREHKYIGLLKKKNRILQKESEIYYDITIQQVKWEDQDAQLVLMNEDNLIQRLNFLKEQSKYKDRLLATVSHDLRTPLNGIIGLLDSSIEGVSEVGVKKS